jgi:hypothetical protein
MCAVALNVPLDYFDLKFFNSLPPSLRAKVTGREPIAAFPPTTDWILRTPPHACERMTTAKFMAKYGMEALAEYNTGYESEYEGEDDDDEDDYNDDDDDDEYEMDLEEEAEAMHDAANSSDMAVDDDVRKAAEAMETID